MQNWLFSTPEEGFTKWLTEWARFQEANGICAHLAVLETLARLIPDSPLSVLDELELWATECGMVTLWRGLRQNFEAGLWQKLHHLPLDYDALPEWYPAFFQSMPLNYRRAAFLIAFLDFICVHQQIRDLTYLQPLRERLAASSRWSHEVITRHLEMALRQPQRPRPPLAVTIVWSHQDTLAACSTCRSMAPALAA